MHYATKGIRHMHAYVLRLFALMQRAQSSPQFKGAEVIVQPATEHTGPATLGYIYEVCILHA